MTARSVHPAPPPPPAPRPDTGTGTPRVGRSWSARRIPSAVCALLICAAAVALLQDVVAVRTGAPGQRWRRSLTHWLTTHPLDGTWVRVGACVVAVLGLWLLALALTPGRRHLLAQRPPVPSVTPYLDRPSAAALLRDTALGVPGVGEAAVTVGRRRARVRAQVDFREREEVRADLRRALEERMGTLALRREPRLRIRLRDRSPVGK